MWLCSKCRDEILPVKTQVCPSCGRISEYGKYCLEDAKPHGLGGIIVSCYYGEGPIKELIHNFKYNNVTELGEILAKMMAKALKDNIAGIGKDIILTAVPLHFLRRAQRGYNQSEILTELVGKNLGLKKLQLLKKIRRTKPQVKKSGKKRKENLKNCFKISKNIDIRGRTIILADDVTTTGTTLNECAKVLREAGAKRVWGLVVAKG